MAIERDNNRKLTSEDYGNPDHSRLQQATRPSQNAPNDSGKPQDLNQLQMPKAPTPEQLRSEIAEKVQSQKQMEASKPTIPSHNELAEASKKQSAEQAQKQQQQNELSQKQSM
jgi:hypothetical protein